MNEFAIYVDDKFYESYPSYFAAEITIKELPKSYNVAKIVRTYTNPNFYNAEAGQVLYQLVNNSGAKPTPQPISHPVKQPAKAFPANQKKQNVATEGIKIKLYSLEEKDFNCWVRNNFK